MKRGLSVVAVAVGSLLAGGVARAGEPVWGNPRIFFRIGFCPEQDAFYDRMTGLEWVAGLARLIQLPDPIILRTTVLSAGLSYVYFALLSRFAGEPLFTAAVIIVGSAIVIA